MANHLESVCMRGAHDYELVDDLGGMPYLRCVTDDLRGGRLPEEAREIVLTSLTEAHRIASTYFLRGRHHKDGKLEAALFEEQLADEMGIVLKDNKSKAHPPASKWWDVFKTIFAYDPNALVHGVLFPQWQIAYSAAKRPLIPGESGHQFQRMPATDSD